MRGRLYLLVLLCFGLLIAFVIWQIRITAKNIADNSIRSSLGRSSEILRVRMDARFADISSTAQSIAGDPRLISGVLSSESPLLHDFADEMRQAFPFEAILIVDSEGRVLVRTDAPDRRGTSVRMGKLFSEPLHYGRVSRGFMLKGRSLRYAAVAPVRDITAPEVAHGAVALMYDFSDDLISEIQSLTNSEVVVCASPPHLGRGKPAENYVLHSSDPNLAKLVQSYVEEMGVPGLANPAASETHYTVDVTMGGEDYAVLVQPLFTADMVPLGAFLVFRSRTELLHPFRQIEQAMLWSGIAALLAACLLASLLAGRFVRPIIALVDFAKGIERGEFPEEVPTPDSKELSELAEALGSMGRNLKLNAVLEDYLAQAAEEEDIASDGWETEVDLVATTDSGPATLRNEDKLVSGASLDDRYRIRRFLGSGAFGAVYQAEDLQLQELVALKVLAGIHPEHTSFEQIRREISLARRITHRNIVRTHDFGVTEDSVYISMEFVRGVTLSQFVRKNGPLPIAMGLILARQMCWALDAAHSAGVVHRDLKPQNILIDRKGVLKIMDFGVALSASERDDDGWGQGALVGTPTFMAPEQFESAKVDRRADIYSAGIVLFFLFSGTVPFPTKDKLRLFHLHLNEKPSKLSSKVPELPPELDAIVERALQKDPEKRFQDMREMAEALAAVSRAV